MAPIILVCGKICSGKSTYARRLARERKLVWLSCDEVMLSLFGDQVNAVYETYHDKVEEMLLRQAAEIADTGIGVILDFGFWGKSDRMQTTAYFAGKGLSCEWHYLDVPDETLYRNAEKRNADILRDGIREYHTDDGLLRKCLDLFEVPDKTEIDVWVHEEAHPGPEEEGGREGG